MPRPRLDPRVWSRRAVAIAHLAPAGLAGLCLALGAMLPAELVWAQIAAATFRSLPRWILAFWGAWSLLIAVRVSWTLPAAGVLGALGLALAGQRDPGPPPESAPVFAVANVNAYSDQTDPGPMERTLADLGADVVITVERRAEHIPGMTRVEDDYDEPLPRPSHASAIFCRQPERCAALVTPEVGSATMKMPFALVRFEDGQCLVGIHAPPPVPYDPTGIGPYVAELARHAAQGRVSRAWGPCRAGDPLVVAGDLNAVPGSRPWREVVALGLRPMLHGWGVYAASWPAGGGWPDFPFFQLDHLFAGAVRAGGIRQVRVPGADHLALVWSSRPE